VAQAAVLVGSLACAGVGLFGEARAATLLPSSSAAETLAGQELARAIEVAFMADPATFHQRIRVMISPNGIELTGVVTNDRARLRALAIARQVAGGDVRDRMQQYRELQEHRTVFNPRLAQDAQARLEREGPQPSVGPIDIEIEADGGIVTLLGRVGTWEEKAQASRCLRGVAGCEAVQNLLEVAQPAAAAIRGPMQTGTTAPSPIPASMPTVAGREPLPLAPRFQPPLPLAPPRTLSPIPPHTLKPLPMPSVATSRTPTSPVMAATPHPATTRQVTISPRQPVSPALPLQRTEPPSDRSPLQPATYQAPTSEGADFYRPHVLAQVMTHPRFQPAQSRPQGLPQAEPMPANTPLPLRQRIAAALGGEVRGVEVRQAGQGTVVVEMRVRPNANLERILTTLYGLPELAGNKIEPRFLEER